jgi:putative ATP-dependent endonuclease of OLD family
VAAKKKTDDVISLVSEDENVPRPRLHKLIIQNFRSIGSKSIEIELDEIVVLVGPNNVGKSSILRAYETVMSHGSKEGRLSVNDFPNGQVDANNLPTIELHTIVYDQAPGERWIEKTSNNEWLIREKWVWDSPNKDPKRQGYDVHKDCWDEQVPWGAPNIANARRPIPHRIDAFATPEKQASEITKLITSLLKGKVADIRTDPDQEKSDYELILERISLLQAKAVKATENEIRIIENEISAYLSRLFPRHKVKFDARSETDLDSAYQPFKSTAELLMGPEDGYFSPIEHQGSGARRTLLWATLRYLSESGDKKSSRPHVLLLDEPEICLHPSAIRDARSVLYELPGSGNWQVMLTSHSPIFIDLSRDNTTIVRVFRDETSAVQSTTLYRPSKAKLDEDDKKNLKLMNICDPYVYEFFFGGKQVVVEGDTEYTAFSIIKEKYPDRYKDVQIIRARGKGIIPAVAKVLMQFAKGFCILHDRDLELTANGKNNPAWGMNKTIATILDMENAKDSVKLIACNTCFETAILGEEAKNDKPYNALEKIRTDIAIEKRVDDLLAYLVGLEGAKLPDGCIHWTAIDDLH